MLYGRELLNLMLWIKIWWKHAARLKFLRFSISFECFLQVVKNMSWIWGIWHKFLYSTRKFFKLNINKKTHAHLSHLSFFQFKALWIFFILVLDEQRFKVNDSLKYEWNKIYLQHYTFDACSSYCIINLIRWRH